MCCYERKLSILCLAALFLKESDISDLWCFSNFEDMQRALVWKCRFIGNYWNPKSKRSGKLCVDELKTWCFDGWRVVIWWRWDQITGFFEPIWRKRVNQAEKIGTAARFLYFPISRYFALWTYCSEKIYLERACETLACTCTIAFAACTRVL